jgi:hypothetical protein
MIQIVTSKPPTPWHPDGVPAYYTVEEVLNHIGSNINRYPFMFARSIDILAGDCWVHTRKISAIKVIRMFYPLGLKEVKEYCEKTYNVPVDDDWVPPPGA